MSRDPDNQPIDPHAFRVVSVPPEVAAEFRRRRVRGKVLARIAGLLDKLPTEALPEVEVRLRLMVRARENQGGQGA